MRSAITIIAKALYSATHNDLSEVEKTYGGNTVKERPTEDEVLVIQFPQTWPDTALGFNEVGGRAITTAYTTIVYTQNEAAVYFGGRFAYLANPNCPTFNLCVARQQMESVDGSSKYQK